MKRTIDNCTLIKKAVRLGIGYCGIQGDKCIGYSFSSQDNNGENDEPCDKCKRCSLCASDKD